MADMLHDNVSFEWRWNYWPLSGNDGVAKVLVQETILTTESNGWSSNESRSPGSNNLSILITLSTDDKSRRRNETTQDRALHDKLLPHVNHATIVVAKKDSGKLDEHLWFNIFLLSKALSSRSPHMTTLRIVAQESELIFDAWAADAREMPNSTTSKAFFPSPYESLAGLPLREGSLQSARTPKGHLPASTTRRKLNVQRPAHVRIDSGMGSSVVVKRSEWVYSSADNETPL